MNAVGVAPVLMSGASEPSGGRDDAGRSIAFRRLVAAPGFIVVAVLTLALGIGANAAPGGIIASVLARPLPLPDADALVAIRARNPKDGQLAPISPRPRAKKFSKSLPRRGVVEDVADERGLGRPSRRSCGA